MLIEPGIEVNAVVQKAPSEADWLNPKVGEQGAANPEIRRGLLARQASWRWEWQGDVIIHTLLRY